MIIDFNNATIQFKDNNIKLNAVCTMSNFINTINKSLYTIDDMNNGYKWVRIKNLNYGKMKINLSACFHFDILSKVNIGVNVYGENRMWESWDYEKEIEAKKIHDKLLQENIKENFLKLNNSTNQYECEYFTIKSVYDSKSDSSYIALTYFNKIIDCINTIFEDHSKPWMLEESHNKAYKKYGIFIVKLAKELDSKIQSYPINWNDKELAEGAAEFENYIKEYYSFFSNKARQKIVSEFTYSWK